MILRYDGHVIKGRVIYSTSKGVPYDIAVIESEKTAYILPCEISDRVPSIGETKILDNLQLITFFNCV